MTPDSGGAAAPVPSKLEFCGNPSCGRIVVQARDTKEWVHWGDARVECLESGVARPGGTRRADKWDRLAQTLSVHDADRLAQTLRSLNVERPPR